jgi:transcriptional regulator with XRE-family HTH domain
VNDVSRKTKAFVKALAFVLRQKRLEAGLSQNELAWRAGLSQQYIGYLEREMRYPSAETLIRIAIAFECELSEIIVEAEQKARGSR